MSTAIPFTLALLVAPAPSQSEAETASTTETAEYTTPDGYLVRSASVTYDDNLPAKTEVEPAMLRSSQPLGFLPSREFWRDPDNARLAVLPISISVFVLIVVVSALLDPPWWIAFLLFPTTMVLAQGLLERYVRREAQRRALVEEEVEPDD